jgi:hypothetical protein
MKKRLSTLLALSAIFALASNVSQAQTVFNLTSFDANNWNFATEPDGGPYSSVPSKTGGTTLSVNFGDTSVAQSSINYNFANTAVAVGETITLTFDFTLTGGTSDQSNGLRFGLYGNNGAALLSSDGITDYDPFASEYSGVGAGYRTGTSAGNGAHFSNDYASGSTPNQLIANKDGGDWKPTSSSVAALGAGSTYTLSLSLERINAYDVDVTSKLNGSEYWSSNVTGDTGTSTHFDDFSTFSIGLNNSAMDAGRGFTLDNVSLAIIPEPTTFFLTMVGLGSFLLFRRNRKS